MAEPGHGLRPRSLAGRFLATLVVSAVLPLLLYGVYSLRGMRAQIDEQVVRVFLPQLARDHGQRLSDHLARVDQACAVVREIARRALDSPLELEAFVEQVELVPDLLDNLLDLLLLADPAGRVVYWQDGQRLGPDGHESRAALIPEQVGEQPWFRAVQTTGGALHLPWGRSPLLHRGLDHRSLDPASHHLGVALDVPRPSGPPGVLFALVRWAEVQQILDAARTVLAEDAHLPGAEVFLVDPSGRIVAHTDRNHYGLPLAPNGLAETLLRGGPAGRAAFTDATGLAGRVGYAACGDDPARQFVLGVTVAEGELFAQSEAFARALWWTIAASVAVLVLWSLLASRTITAPVQALAAAARRIAAGDLAVAVPARGGAELAALAATFNQMAGELAAGRARLAAAERDQAWAEMARQVAHEVKNPLQPMRLTAQLLQRAARDGDPRAPTIAERLARTVLEQTEALDRIASDFRAFAGPAAAARSVVAVDTWLPELLAECRGLFAGRQLQLELLPPVPTARLALDLRALSRVFVNLIQNALDAAPEGAHVTLQATTTASAVGLAVVDRGPGIPAAQRSHLFEPYFTTKTSGTGLGLAICRRLVEAHGGTIRLCRSEPGHTEFAIELPRLDHPPTG
jgi:signal transduction histidine kinase